MEGLGLQGIRFLKKGLKVIKEKGLLKIFQILKIPRKVKSKVLDYGFLQRVDGGYGKTKKLDGKEDWRRRLNEKEIKKEDEKMCEREENDTNSPKNVIGGESSNPLVGYSKTSISFINNWLIISPSCDIQRPNKEKEKKTKIPLIEVAVQPALLYIN